MGSDRSKKAFSTKLDPAGLLPRHASALTLEQARHWFLELYHEPDQVLTVAGTWTLQGKLALAPLEWALLGHLGSLELPALRFGQHEGRVHVVPALPETRLPVLDLSALPASARSQLVEAQVARARLGFIGAERASCHAILFRLEPDHDLLHLECLCTVADRPSLELIMREVARLYREKLAGGVVIVQEWGRSYFDLVRKQRQFLQTVWGKQVLGWWARRLEDPPRPPLLQGQRPRSAPLRTHACQFPLVLTERLTEQVSQCAARHGVPARKFYLAAYVLLLRAYGGQDDFLLGLLEPGRQGSDSEGVVGPFENLLPLRVTLAGNPRFGVLIGQLEVLLRETRDAAQLPFALLAQEFQRERALEHEALCTVAFACESAGPCWSIGLAAAKPYVLAETRTRLELCLRIDPDSRSLVLTYNTSAFDMTWARHFLGDWLRLLELGVAHPEANCATLLNQLTLEPSPLEPAPTAHQEGGPQGAPMCDWIELELMLCIQDCLKLQPSATHVNLFELGVHSLQLPPFLHRLRKTFAVTLSLAEVLPNLSVFGIARILRERLFGEPLRLDLGGPQLGQLLPLTPQQKRLWFQQFLKGENPALHLSATLRIQGQLRPELLERALARVHQAHPILRANFVRRDGLPIALVTEDGFFLPTHDLTHLPADLAHERSEEILSDRLRKVLAGEGCLPLRAGVVRLEAETWLVQVVLHRLAGDESSLHLILTQALNSYAQEAAGLVPLVAKPRFTFVDYAHWQRGAGHHALQDQLEYWIAQLADLPCEHGLATDHPRPPVPSLDADQIEFIIEQALAERLHQLCQAHGICLSIALQATFALLIARYGDQRIVALGSTVPMRHHGELEHMIGPLANRVVLRHDFSEQPSFANFLRQTRLINLQAYENSDVPFESVVEALAPPRDTCREPLCQVLFDCQTLRPVPPRIPGLDIALEEEPVLAMFHDLALLVTVTTGALHCRLAYSTDLFEETTIVSLAKHFLRLLASAVAEPERVTGTLAIHDDSELAAMLSVWNGECRGSTQALAPAAAFRKICLQQPGHSAVVDLARGERLNYRQLELRAEALARRLTNAGIRPGEVVALYARPGCDWSIAVVAAVLAGACLLPLEPDTHQPMVARLLEDAGARLLLVDRGASWHEPTTCPVLVLEQALEAELWDDCEDSFPGETPALLRYSTDGRGHLCAAPLSLRAVGLFLEAAGSRLALDARSRILLAYPRWNDVLAFPLLPLCQGAVLYIAPPDPPMNQLCELHRFTHCMTTPDLAHSLLDADLQLLLDDDFLTHEFRLEAALHQCRPLLWHHGFETCTWWATRLLVGDDPSVPWQEEAAGTVLPHKRAYILDGFGAPIPSGGAGELYLGGEALSPGFTARPALTAARFVPDAFGAAAGRRLFRTRIRARFAPDGQIVLLNPLDNRIKHHGQWLDLGDLQAVLEAHPDVVESVVGKPLGELLPVFLRCVEGHHLDGEALAHFLAERLLTPICRLQLLPLERLARDRSGKPILPRRPEELEALCAEGSAPRNREEVELLHIFAEVLQLGNLGIHDDFFQLGGHSFLVIRVLELIRRRLGHRLPARIFFELPRVADLAHKLAEYGSQTHTLMPFPSAATTHHHLSQAQARYYRHQQLGLTLAHQGQVLRFYGPLRVAALERALQQVVARHRVLATRCTHQSDAVWLVADERCPRLAVINLSRLAGEAGTALERALIERATARPFTLEQGPLWRVALLRHDPWESTLVLALHPLICDPTSVAVLLGDLARCYRAELEGRPALLPCADVQFADFAAWQRGSDQCAAQKPQLDYWRSQLSGLVPLQLPSDRPRRGERSLAPAHIYRRPFPRQLELALEDLGHRQGTTLFTALEALFAALLGRLAGVCEVTLLTPVCYRAHHDLSYLVGQFTHPVPLRNDLRGGPSFLQLLKRTRLLTQKAFANADVDFEQVLAQHPLTQLQSGSAITFELVYARQGHATFKDLETVAEDLPPQAACSDLALCLRRGNSELELELAYKSGLFETGTIHRLAASYVRLIEACLSNPERAVVRAELFDDIQREFLLRAWCGLGVNLPPPASFASRFAAVVATHPQQLALERLNPSNSHWTYADLAGAAWKLVERLRLLGVQGERVVGILIPRSPEWVVAVLGSTLAGLPFVLLDPEWPPARNAQMLRELGADLLLVSHKSRTALPRAPVETLLVESRASGHAQIHDLPPSSLAFLLPTAAALGRTTLAAVTQSALAHLLSGLSHCAGGGQRRHLLSSPVCLDMTLPQLFWPLAEGATLVLGELVDADAELLEQTLQHQRIDVWAATPSFWQAMLATGWRPHERLIALSGGEHLPDHVAALLVRYCRLVFNLYGTSEVLVWSSARRVHRDQVDPAALGGPLPGNELFLLDPALNLVSIGETGEICLGGACLSRGYFGHPAQTAAAFVPHPFAVQPGARLFRTGDLAHWHNDGSLGLLRRLDRQIKLGGYRVDPTEVEAALALHPAIIRSAVLVHGRPHHRLHVTAFVDCAGSLPPSPKALREYLEQHLPNHMIPRSFRFATLPMTASGELDRGLLYEMLDEREEHEGSAQEPRTPMQRILAVIFREVFQRDRIAIDQPLFHQGGDLDHAEEVIARIRDVVALELSTQHLLQRPTIAALATYLEGLQPPTTENR